MWQKNKPVNAQTVAEPSTKDRNVLTAVALHVMFGTGAKLFSCMTASTPLATETFVEKLRTEWMKRITTEENC